jgi:hypothetical protein
MTSATTVTVTHSLRRRVFISTGVRALVRALRRVRRLVAAIAAVARARSVGLVPTPWHVAVRYVPPRLLFVQISDAMPMRLLSASPLTGALTALAPPTAAA